MTKEEQQTVLAEMVVMLRSAERFLEQDVLNRYPFETPLVRRLLWEAREVVRREDGIVFGVTPGWPGNFRRLDWRQVAEQATRQRAAGTRKHRRAGEKLRLAAANAPDDAKERLSAAADRVALRLAMRAAKTG